LAQPNAIRTLLVDDSVEFLTGASLWILGRTDLVVVGKVRGGLRAIEAVGRLRPDLVIMDCVLPELDGFRVARLIKSRPNPPLVIIATFATSQAARDEALAAGADGFIAKDEFAGGLERLLDVLLAQRGEQVGTPTSPGTPARLGSRTEQDP
jgi:CheY-like chemotaxis protein